MRAVLTHDLDLAARALAFTPPQQRAGIMARIIARAHAADKYRKATGRRHPLWGAGTLADAALCEPLAPPPRRYDPAAAEALAAALAGLALWRHDPARRP